MSANVVDTGSGCTICVFQHSLRVLECMCLSSAEKEGEYYIEGNVKM